MDTIKFNHQIKMIAHRGVSGLERENTCAAFVVAGNRSYFGIETDVHVTKDGKFIVFHDDTTNRLIDADLVVDETDFETLRSLPLKDMDEEFRSDLHMPPLEDYIRICKKYDKESVLELKNHFAPEDIDRLIAEIGELGWLERTTFISFDLPNCICLREKLPQQRIQYLLKWVTDEAIKTMLQYGFELDADARKITREQIEACHKVGIKVNVWTVNSLEVAERLIQYGVDYMTTDILE